MEREASRTSHAYAQVESRSVGPNQRLGLAVVRKLNIIRDLGSGSRQHPKISEHRQGHNRQRRHGEHCAKAFRFLLLRAIFAGGRPDRMCAGWCRDPRIRERFQSERKIRRRLKPLFRVLLQTTQHHSLQTRGCLGCKFRDRRGFLVQDRAHRVGGCGPAKRRLPHHHLVQDCAEGKNIGAMIGRQSPHLLRRHIAHSSHGYARDGQRRRHIRQGFLRLNHLRQPEVQNFDAPVFGNE